PVPGHRHARGEGQGRGPGRDPGRPAPARLAHDERGGRRVGAGAGCARDRGRQSDERGRGTPVNLALVTGARDDAQRERPPLVPVLLALLAVLFFAVPLAGLIWKAQSSTAWNQLTQHEALQALRLSLVTSVAATAVAPVLGV